VVGDQRQGVEESAKLVDGQRDQSGWGEMSKRVDQVFKLPIRLIQPVWVRLVLIAGRNDRPLT
jgi:hypothetical protein